MLLWILNKTNSFHYSFEVRNAFEKLMKCCSMLCSCTLKIIIRSRCSRGSTRNAKNGLQRASSNNNTCSCRHAIPEIHLFRSTAPCESSVTKAQLRPSWFLNRASTIPVSFYCSQQKYLFCNAARRIKGSQNSLVKIFVLKRRWNI